MASRREFVRMGALAMGALAAGREVSAAAVTRANREAMEPLYAVIFDDRFPESADFAASACARGERTLGLDRGDVTRVWYDDLYHRWRQGPAAIAGLTTPGAAFVLETFGNDSGLRLQFRGEHRLLGDRVEHRLYGPDAMLRTALPLESRGCRWSAHMQQVVCAVRPARFERDEARLMTALRAGPASGGNLLVSWVLVPRRRRSMST